MQWVTRTNVEVDRVACSWPITTRVDAAEYIFVPVEETPHVGQGRGAIPFDVPDVELGDHRDKC